PCIFYLRSPCSTCRARTVNALREDAANHALEREPGLLFECVPPILYLADAVDPDVGHDVDGCGQRDGRVERGFVPARECAVLEVACDEVGERSHLDLTRRQSERACARRSAALQQRARDLIITGGSRCREHETARPSQPLVVLEQADLLQWIDHGLAVAA